jgi:hypothetical protein
MLATVARGHDAVMHVMRARLKNLQTVRALWTPSSIKVSLPLSSLVLTLKLTCSVNAS